MAKKKEELSYEVASREIQAILSRLERGETDIDAVLEEVNRATALIGLCKSRLHQLTDGLKKAFGEIENSDISENQ
jgi:exodeoxyribonuclease VII small subunit